MAVSRDSHEWGGQNGFLTEVLLGYDLTVTQPGVSNNARTPCPLESSGNQVGSGL